MERVDLPQKPKRGSEREIKRKTLVSVTSSTIIINQHVFVHKCGCVKTSIIIPVEINSALWSKCHLVKTCAFIQ